MSWGHHRAIQEFDDMEDLLADTKNGGAGAANRVRNSRCVLTGEFQNGKSWATPRVFSYEWQTQGLQARSL